MNLNLKAMNPNELRIGNLIYKFGIDYVGINPIVDKNDFEVIKVDLLVLQNIIDYDGTTNFYYTEPIPLTEEIKEQLNKNQNILIDKYGFVIFKNGYAYSFVFEDYPYLHLFQNLYFALKGKELTVKV